MKTKEKQSFKSIVNRSARYEYNIGEKYEAGIQLQGAEVKSLRLGRAQLKESFAQVSQGEIYLVNCHISPYTFASNDEYEPTRRRKLLLSKKEIDEISGKLSQKNWTLVPLKIYLKNNKFKVALGLGRGKREYEKREQKKKKDIKREVERMVKAKYRG